MRNRCVVFIGFLLVASAAAAAERSPSIWSRATSIFTSAPLKAARHHRNYAI